MCSPATLIAILVLSSLSMACVDGSDTGLDDDTDLLIRGARIVDGTGSPWFVGDVAIVAGRISQLAPSLAIEADRIIEAEGRVLAPGFIDIHTHVESSDSRDGLERLPRADNYILDGVTTIVTGNCGGSEIDVAAYRNRLSDLGINVATLIGHNSVRREVMGYDDRAPNEDEMRRMEALVDQAMRDGAVGFSTGLLYVPGTYAATDEVVRLASVASRYGGLYSSHIREQAALLHDSIDEAVRVGREANTRVQISHFKIKGRTRWGTIGEALGLVDGWRKRGVDVVIDVYPYERASTNLGVTLPRWAVAGSAEDIAGRITDADMRDRIIAEMKTKLDDDGYPDYSYATVASYPANAEYNGMTISEISRLLGREPGRDGDIETILEMMIDGGRSGSRYGASMIYHYMSNDDVDTIVRYPNAAIASDGSIVAFGRGQPHPRSYGTNARVLADYVRERNVLTLEDAVRRMTSLPARTFGFTERGVIRPGMVADLVLFDPDRVIDKATFEDPHRYSGGFDYVLVNGVPVVADGQVTDERPGRFVSQNSGG